jgi:hypothetical protein
MKRLLFIVAACCLLVVAAAPANAQVDLNFFKRSGIAKYLNPVVGKGAEYTSTEKDSSAEKTQIMTMGVVGKESFEGKEAFWMEVVSDGGSHSMLMKMLITRDDFESHKVVMQVPGQPAMEMPFNSSATSREEKMAEKFKEWHSVGSEPVTVPAGTFVCDHLHNDKTNADMWVSEKITPFGMVKHVDGKRTMVLTKLIPDFSDRITGPVRPFDPQAFRPKRDQNQ